MKTKNWQKKSIANSMVHSRLYCLKAVAGKTFRSACGQAIAESAAALSLITALSIGLILFILGVGTIEFYQLKLINVAQVMALDVVNSTFWEGRQVNAKPTTLDSTQQAKLQQLLADLQLPSSPTNFTATVTDDPSHLNCVVKLTERGLPLIGGGFIPNVVTLSASAVEPWGFDKPPFLVSIVTSIGPIEVPAYRPQGFAGFPATSQTTTGSGSLFVFNSPGAGVGVTGINLGGFGSSSPSGSPTDTGSVLGAFAPYVAPTFFAQPTSFPAF